MGGRGAPGVGVDGGEAGGNGTKPVFALRISGSRERQATRKRAKIVCVERGGGGKKDKDENKTAREAGWRVPLKTVFPIGKTRRRAAAVAADVGERCRAEEPER